MEFDHITLTRDPEGIGAHRQAARDSHTGTGLIRPLVGFFVQGLPLGGEFVLPPNLLKMDQRALARAIEPVLKSREREKLVFGEHGRA